MVHHQLRSHISTNSESETEMLRQAVDTVLLTLSSAAPGFEVVDCCTPYWVYKETEYRTVTLALPLLASGISSLSQAEWNVSILDHMLNLTTHGQHKQHDPINHQNRPEHRNIKDFKPSAKEANGNSPGSTMPELEFRQTADERTELIVLIRWESCRSTFFEIVGFESGVEFGLEESEEEVEEIDANGVCDNVPALGEDYAQHEDAEKDTRSNPSVQCERRGLVEVVLIHPGILGRVRGEGLVGSISRRFRI